MIIQSADEITDLLKFDDCYETYLLWAMWFMGFLFLLVLLVCDNDIRL